LVRISDNFIEHRLSSTKDEAGRSRIAYFDAGTHEHVGGHFQWS